MARPIRAKSALAGALMEWAKEHRDSVGLPATKRWSELVAALDGPAPPGSPPCVLATVDTIAELFRLGEVDRRLFALVVLRRRAQPLCALMDLAVRHGLSPAALVTEEAGAGSGDPIPRLRNSAIIRLGLAQLSLVSGGGIDVDLPWRFAQLFDEALVNRDQLLAAMVGPVQTARLSMDDFGHVTEVALLLGLLHGAARTRAAGVNILIHGPPGTGKTELTRTLATAAGLQLYAVGEVDEDQEEPTRYDRVCAYRRAQRLLADQADGLLMFDEMEDLIGDATMSDGDRQVGRKGSKVFVNRMLEENRVPTVWVTNTIGNVDPAILRRMSFVLKLGLPGPAAAAAMTRRVAAEEGTEADPELLALVAARPEAASVLRTAIRTGRMADRDGAAAEAAGSLVTAMTGRQPLASRDQALDTSLYESALPIEPMLERIAASEVTDVSLLLAGPPGTGKTVLAHHLARRLDRPLLVRRASDLLSKWVGGTERAIAAMFAEARESGSLLLLDEADSVLQDRSTARASWEVTQVNELLTWLDHHPMPVVAATNRIDMLDRAALRRFLFKIDLKPLGPERARQAFVRFFGLSAPTRLDRVAGLTPGDFAVVARRRELLGIGAPEQLVDELLLEVEARPESGLRVGF